MFSTLLGQKYQQGSLTMETIKMDYDKNVP